MSTISPHFYAQAPWSLSKSDLAAKCTKAYQFKYIDKVRGVRNGAEAKVGVAAHAVQEYVLKGQSPLTALEQALEENEGLTQGEIEEVHGLFPAIIAYAARTEGFRVRRKVIQEFYEQEWAIDADGNPCDYKDPKAFFRGVVDHGMLCEDRSLVIVDHKTGKPGDLEKHTKQLDSYAVLAAAHLPEMRAVRAGIHYLRTPDPTKNLLWHVARSREYAQRTLAPWLKYLLHSRAEKLDVIAPTLTPLCNWCEYKHVCPEGLAHAEEWLAQKEQKKKESAARSRARRKEMKNRVEEPDTEQEELEAREAALDACAIEGLIDDM